MLLTIDVGNSQTKLGLFDEQKLLGHWRIVTDKHATIDDLVLKLERLLKLDDVSRSAIESVAIASVVPQLTAHWLILSHDYFEQKAFLLSSKHCTGMRICYENPESLGADRIAVAIAASKAGVPTIVVDYGTATNIEVVDNEGVYIGGVIMPGLETSATALFAKASKLSVVEMRVPPAAIGSSTLTAVQSGLVLGEAVRTDGMIERIWEQLGYKTTVVATGGFATLMHPLCRHIDAVDPYLSLKGIQMAYRANAD